MKAFNGSPVSHTKKGSASYAYTIGNTGNEADELVGAHPWDGGDRSAGTMS